MSTLSITKPTWLVLLRDVSSYLGGWALLVHQTLFADEVNLVLAGIAAALIGVPGFEEMRAMRARQQSGAETQAGTAKPPSSPPEPASSPAQS